MDPGRSLHICVPAYGCRVFLDFLACLVRLRHEAARRGIPTVVRMVGNESLIPRGRNMMAADFMASGMSHMLFVDADIIFSADDIFEMMDADKDVVCGIYAKKAVVWDRIHSPEYASEPICQRGIDFNINFDPQNVRFEGRLCRVLDAATGLMMIKRETIVKMSADHAYLTCVNDMNCDKMPIKEYCALFDCMIDPDSRRYLSEDYAFCRRAQWSGLEVWALMSCITGHIGAMHVDGKNPQVIEDLGRRFHGASSSSKDGAIRSIEDLRRAYMASVGAAPFSRSEASR